ncbi:MAG TPA: hypothetical protein VGR28_12820 [Candidatus Thermoplasmatota archaeon]|jgi:hypothetical protein|nr:hypothetical protein [Candidatus Thermoplasmatota archaeon]
MAEGTLVAAAVFSLASGSLYTFVGFKVLGRPTSPDARLAARLFSIWWFGLAAATLMGGVTNLTGTLATPSVGLFQAYTFVVLLTICVALWGLLYYLLYLFTGRKWLIWPLSAFYLAYFAWLSWLILGAGATGVEVGRWSVTLRYAQPLQGPEITTALALLVFPQILGALAYFTLYFKLTDRTLRFRVAVVSWSIVLWFMSSFLANIAGLTQSDAWQVASRAIGFSAALAILIAYHPPGWMRRRFRIAGVGEAAPPLPGSAPSPPPPPRGLPTGAVRAPTC